MERNFRFYVKLRTTLNIDSATICQELRTAFGDNAPSNLTIQKWCFYQHDKGVKMFHPENFKALEKKSLITQMPLIVPLFRATLHLFILSFLVFPSRSFWPSSISLSYLYKFFFSIK
jgi:choline-glycine betaine transporter